MPSESHPESSAPVTVTFARPEESGPFRRRLAGLQRVKRAELPVFAGRYRETDVIVVHVGIGLESAARTIRAVLAAGKPRRIIAAGFAGGLDPALRIGDTVTEDFPGPRDDRKRVILSLPDPLETIAEKDRAFRESGARVVDMETSALAEACDAAGVPMTAIRAVSDTAGDALPVPFGKWFDPARQRPRPLALLGFLARNPSRIVPFARFVLRLPRVAAALADAIEGNLRGPGAR